MMMDMPKNGKIYGKLIKIALPILLQLMITQLVSLVDNLMMGQVGTFEMTGVSVANQGVFIFTCCVFGAMSGPSIYASQFHGAQNMEGVKTCVRFKCVVGLIIALIFGTIFATLATPIVKIFTTGAGTEADKAIVITNGVLYLHLMMATLIPFIVKEIIGTSLREVHETVIPMAAAMSGVVVNIILDYVLIFGHCGFKALGTAGAAYATIASRCVECLIVVIYALIKCHHYAFFQGIFSHFKIPFSFIKMVSGKCMLLTMNEILWSLSLSTIAACYSRYGLIVVAAYTISNTIRSIFITMGQSLGNSSQIVLGPYLGASRQKEAMSLAWRIMAFSFVVTLILSGVMVALGWVVPGWYQTTEEVKGLAKTLIIISACTIPLASINTVLYFIIRCGGQIFLTVIFDSGFMWTIQVPLAFILSHTMTDNFILVFIIVEFIQIIKMVVGMVFVKKGVWCRNIVSHKID